MTMDGKGDIAGSDGDAEVIGYRLDPAAPSPAADGSGLTRSIDVLGSSYAALEREQIEVRFRAGSYAERAAPNLLRRAVRASEQLRGFGSEPWGSTVVIWLVEPYAGDDGQLVDSGTLVDGPRREIAYVVTPDTEIEDPHRAMALVYGAALPASERKASLIEAYGLAVAGVEASGSIELDTEISFVQFLIDSEGDEAFRRYVAAEPSREADICRQLYGASLPRLRERWRQEAAVGAGERVRIGEFAKMSARYLRPYRVRQLELFFHMLLGLSFTLAFPLVTQSLFDDAIPSGSFSRVGTLLLVLGVAFVVSLAADVRRSYLHAWIGGAVTRDLRQKVYNRLQALPARWHRKHDQGDVLTRLFADVSQVQGGLTEVLTLGAFQVTSVAVSAGVMLSINWMLGLVVLIGAPVIALIFSALAGGAVKRSKDVQANQSSLMSIAAENHRAGNVVRLFSLSGRESRRFGSQANRLFRSQQRLQMWMGLFDLSINLVLRILRLVALGFGGWLILEGRFTLGGLVAFLSIMGEVLNPITDIANIGQSIQGSMGSLLRVNELLAEEVEADGESLSELPPVTGAIELRDVSFGYGPEVRALDDVSCEIPVGSRVAFVGPSGSGKSTVLRLLMCLDEPESGAITVDGIDLRTTSPVSWRRQLGVVLQDSFLFDATVRENVAVGSPNATDADIAAAITQAELDGFVDGLPEGLDSLVGEDGSALSGGQRQRVAIARALVRQPPVLLLDEATSALDPTTERQLNETLRSASDGRTLISVTHRLGALPSYDHIFVMDQGRIVEHGDHADLLGRNGLYARLWAEQSGDGQVKDDAGGANYAAALAELPVFASLAEVDLDDVVATMWDRSLRAGERLTTSDELLVIGSGQVLVGSGSRAPSIELGEGDVIGLRAIMGSPVPTVVEAATPVEFRGLALADLVALERRYPAIAEARSGQSSLIRPTGTLLGPLARPERASRSRDEATPDVRTTTGAPARRVPPIDDREVEHD